MLQLITGSFLEGCGVIVCKEDTGDFYHLIVHKEKETGRLFVEIDGVAYYEANIE